MKEKSKEINMFKELDCLNVDSKRVTQRIIKTANTLYKNMGKSVSAASENVAEAKAIYRLLDNNKFKKESLIEAHKKGIMENILSKKIKVILCPQDTTELDYTGLKATKDMGNIGREGDCAKGLMLHTTIALTEEGVPLGMLNQKIICRNGYKRLTDNKRARLPIEEKESYKWIEAIEDIKKDFPEEIRAITICDREGDFFELFEIANEKKQEFLVRATYNRNTSEEKKSFDIIQEAETVGSITVKVPRDTRNGKADREAKLSIKYKEIELKKPVVLKNSVETVRVNIVLAKEENAPEDVTPIQWYLLTNISLSKFEDAVLMVKWYVQRWKIERFHYVLKSGCRVEKIQSRETNRIMKMITLLSIIAIKILNITYYSREHGDTTCEEFFQEEEWKVLYCVANRTKQVPDKVPTIKEAVHYLAKLGGFLGRKSDKEPGVECIWRGMHDFNVIMRNKNFLA